MSRHDTPPAHLNWSRQYPSNPTVVVAPKTVAELQAVVTGATDYPSPLLAVGSAHSNSGCTVLRGGTAVSLEHFVALREPADGAVVVGAGNHLLDVHRFLAERGLQLPFTPEIGNATLGSVACCCLKDAALGESSGFAVSMIRAIRYVDAAGVDRVVRAGEADFYRFTSTHGLGGIVYEVTLAVQPMQIVSLRYVTSSVHDAGWPSFFARTLADNDGAFGLLDASTGRFVFETRNLTPQRGEPNALERVAGALLQRIFKYFNPIMGVFEGRWWSRLVRLGAYCAFATLGVVFRRGLRNYRNLKPIDYGPPYRFRWDFHFWAFPVAGFVERTLPAFLDFYAAFRRANPRFDERGLLACYRVRHDERTLLSPSHDGDAITLDPVRPMSDDPEITALWDQFCVAYNDFAANHGGRCTFNQTKNLGPGHAEAAFGARWSQFRADRQQRDPEGRFLSPYFARLLGLTDD